MALFGRRTLLLASASALALAWLAKPKDRGANHNPHFARLNQQLKEAGLGRPRLLIDQAALDHNIDTLTGHINRRFQYRVVAKSLPSIALLQYVMARAGTQRLMVFHQPFINQLAEAFPDADMLLGKPMPVAAARTFYQQLATQDTHFNPASQLQWLIDTPERLNQYQQLAGQLQQPLRLSIEIDLGLHRGGVQDWQQLADMVRQIQAEPLLSLAGLMGYEPHLAKLPGSPGHWRDKAMARYRDALAAVRGVVGDAPLTLNCGGSPTYQLYDQGDFPFNELSAGSCLLKPGDFDIATLQDHVPAAYIAAPVLKRMARTQIPGIDLGWLQSLWDPNKARAYFIYGGYWKARPVSPAGLTLNGLYGRSTNQELLNSSDAVQLAPDDWVFLRPDQSEAVLLQFGDLVVLNAANELHHWPILKG